MGFSYKCDFYQDQLFKMEEILQKADQEKALFLKNFSEKTQNLQEIKQKCDNFKHILDKILLKTSSVSSEYHKISQENQRLIEENKLLNTKAGLGFEGLTPRPNIPLLCEEKNMEISSFLPKTKNKITTRLFIDNLLNKISDFQGKLSFFQPKRKETEKGSIRRSAAIGNTDNKKRDFTIEKSANLKGFRVNSQIFHEEIKDFNEESPKEIKEKREIIEEIIEAKKMLENL